MPVLLTMQSVQSEALPRLSTFVRAVDWNHPSTGTTLPPSFGFEGKGGGPNPLSNGRNRATISSFGCYVSGHVYDLAVAVGARSAAHDLPTVFRMLP
jgi:hypothetical protein